MPLDEIAKRYAEQLFLQKIENTMNDYEERVAAIKRDFAKRGMIQSGGYINELAQLGIARLEYVARARVDSLLSAYTRARIRLDDQVVDEILAQVIPLCDSQRKSLIKRMEEKIRHTFGPQTPSGFQGALAGEIERDVSRIVANIRRELTIRRDEAILEARHPSRRQTEDQQEWDAFICHASEDKQQFVLPLANELGARGLRVWYDDFVLDVGDSLREAIDRGLACSRFGVVVLSPHFFAKDWPQKELEGLVAKEIGGKKVILPVWHKVGFEDVRKYSPTLAGRVAAKSSDGLDKVVAKLLDAMRIPTRTNPPATADDSAHPAKSMTETSSKSSQEQKRRKQPKHRLRPRGVIAAGRDVNVGRDIVVNVRGRSKGRTTIPIPGTVAQDKWKLNYLKYLGHRYSKLKEWQVKQSGQSMQYFRIWSAYRNEMKSTVENTPLELFNKGVAFLKKRIDNTMIGRIRKSRGQKLYRDFEKYLALGEDEIELPSQ
ncbi:toll/interleukin-1 receptor domain-containing protein [Acidobacteriia bacterium AH_259_A11_L15]|nr:toll/interleukin-1 receptor domain-containing protein [Acidobacteriia bacterium AH_259_A11_L15]